MKKFLLILSLSFLTTSYGQESLLSRYTRSLDSLEKKIQQGLSSDFKESVFLVENTFEPGKLDREAFERDIQFLVTMVKAYLKANNNKGYKYADSINMYLNLGIFRILKDTVIITPSNNLAFKSVPYSYDFIDFTGEKDWRKMFVTKLLKTQKGNCHSLPYLYKILANELGARCWLSLAPNHIYIKNRCKSLGWYNTELTSGTFPMDAWIMASGYLPLQAIQNGIYMDTLNNIQSIALCILDLAKGYEHQSKNYEDGFILKCCDLSLKYFPKNVQAMLLKAETLKRVYEIQQGAKKGDAVGTYAAMEAIYIKLFDLGYREMPEKMYMDWLQSVNKEKEKYQNKQFKRTVIGN